MRPFREIHFGFAEAEKESASEPNLLLDGYLDTNGAAERLLEGDAFLVLGHKGSGKSSIAQHLYLRSKDDSGLFVRLAFLSDFPFERFAKGASAGRDEHLAFQVAWSILLLLYLIGSVSGDEGATRDIDFDKAVEVLRSRQLLPTTELRRLAISSVKQSVRLPLPIGDIGSEHTYSASTDGIFLADQLRTVVREVETASRHLLVIDGLDDVLVSTPQEYELLAALVYEVNRLNAFLAEGGNRFAKVVLICRTDLFERLPGSNKNKIRQDSSVELDWSLPHGESRSAPLFRLVNLKARVSDPTIVDVIDEYIPTSIGGGRTSASSLLDYTRQTPRDVLQLLRSIQTATESVAPSTHEVNDGITRYALHYFLPELKDELAGFVAPDEIEMIFDLLAGVDRSQFDLKTLQARVIADERFRSLDLGRVLGLLYEASAIGSVYQRPDGTTYLDFKYRNPHSSLNPRHDMIRHPALTRALRRPDYRERAKRSDARQPDSGRAPRSKKLTSKQAKKRAEARRQEGLRQARLNKIPEEHRVQALARARDAALRVLETGDSETLPKMPSILVDLVVRDLLNNMGGLVARSTRSESGRILRISRAPTQSKAGKARLRTQVRAGVEEHVRTGRPVELEPMPIADRLYVRQTLEHGYQLPAETVGEGDQRRIVIGTRAMGESARDDG